MLLFWIQVCSSALSVGLFSVLFRYSAPLLRNLVRGVFLAFTTHASLTFFSIFALREYKLYGGKISALLGFLPGYLVAFALLTIVEFLLVGAFLGVIRLEYEKRKWCKRDIFTFIFGTLFLGLAGTLFAVPHWFSDYFGWISGDQLVFLLSDGAGDSTEDVNFQIAHFMVYPGVTAFILGACIVLWSNGIVIRRHITTSQHTHMDPAGTIPQVDEEESAASSSSASDASTLATSSHEFSGVQGDLPHLISSNGETSTSRSPKNAPTALNFIDKRIPAARLRLTAVLTSLALFACSLVYTFITLPIGEVISSAVIHSNYIENNYVAPETSKLHFPQKKRNLIHIYMESVENSYYDKANGGYMPENLMPDLEKLTKENISFSNTDRLGGPEQTYGAVHSVAAMVNMWAGVPMKSSPDNGTGRKMNYPSFLTLGDIYKAAGYQTEFILGSRATVDVSGGQLMH